MTSAKTQSVEPPSVRSIRDKSMATKNTKSAEARGYAAGGDFYNGIEWLACWLLDNVEGETITEEQLRPWAAKAWTEHLKPRE